jgi:hypothetical protein
MRRHRHDATMTVQPQAIAMHNLPFIFPPIVVKTTVRTRTAIAALKPSVTSIPDLPRIERPINMAAKNGRVKIG